MRLRILPALLVVVASLVASNDVSSALQRTASLASAQLTRRAPLSVGAPNAGQLQSGEHLNETAFVRVVPEFAARDYRWGLPSLIRSVERAARLVHQRFPPSVLGVGDISRRDGGEIGQHRSHQSGRDADIAFYCVDRNGTPFSPAHFVRFDAEGRSHPDSGVRFDDARNWALVEAFLTDPSIRAQRIFVSSGLRQRLLREAERTEAPLVLRIKAAEILMQPKAGVPHDDHFHVRIGCPFDQAGICEIAPRRTTPAPRSPGDVPQRLSARSRAGTQPRRPDAPLLVSRDVSLE